MPSSDLAPQTRPRIQQISYASGNLGKSLVWATFDTVLLFYLTAIAGLPLSVAGLIIMIALIWDGLGDLLIGYWADKTGRSDFLRILLIIGAPVCGIAFAALFYTSIFSAAWRVGAIALLCWTCRIGYTLCDVAHNAMLVNMSLGERSAAVTSGLRLMFSAVGTAAVGLAFKISLGMPTPDAQQSAFAGYAALGGIAYIATLLAATGISDNQLKSGRNAATLKIWTASWSLLRNASYRRLCVLIVMQAGVTALFMKGLPFIGKAYFAGPAWAGDAIIIITVAQLVALPTFMFLARQNVPNRALLRASHAIMAASLIALMLSIAVMPPLSPLAVIGIGVGLSGMNISIWAKLALVIRETILPEAHLHAFPMGLFLAILKCAAGMGSGILAFSLSAVKVAGAQPEMTIFLVAIAAPFASSIICILFTNAARPAASPMKHDCSQN